MFMANKTQSNLDVFCFFKIIILDQWRHFMCHRLRSKWLWELDGTFTGQVDAARRVAMGCCRANVVGVDIKRSWHLKKNPQTFYPNLTKWASGISPRSRRQTWCVGNEFLGEFRHSDQTAAGLRGRHLAFVPHLSVITKTISGAEAPAALSRCQQVSKGIERVHF